MARISVEQRALTDPRFRILARLARLADADHARGKCEHVWNEAQERGTYFLPEAIVDAASGVDGFGDAMVQADLAERTEDGKIRIRGTEGRIEWLGERREAAQRGGETTKAKWKAKGRPLGLPLASPTGRPNEGPLTPAPALTPTRGEREEPPPASPEKTWGGSSLIPIEQIDAFVHAWNECRGPFRPVIEAGDGRLEAIRQRLREEPDLSVWRETFTRMTKSRFLRGLVPNKDGKAPWVASFDWIIKNEQNRIHVLEGKYDDKVLRKPNASVSSFI